MPKVIQVVESEDSHRKNLFETYWSINCGTIVICIISSMQSTGLYFSISSSQTLAHRRLTWKSYQNRDWWAPSPEFLIQEVWGKVQELHLSQVLRWCPCYHHFKDHFWKLPIFPVHVGCWIVHVLAVMLWPILKKTLPGVGKSKTQERKIGFIAIVTSYS